MLTLNHFEEIQVLKGSAKKHKNYNFTLEASITNI